jgi:hypothetical protein
MRLKVLRSDEVLRRTHGGTHREWARDVRDGCRNMSETGQIVVARLRRLLFEGVKLFVFALEFLLLEAAQRLAIRTCLMSAAMSARNVS